MVKIERPLLIYDGDCGFCLRRAEGLRRRAGDALVIATSQAAAASHPSIPTKTFERTVVLVEADGTVRTGAEAVLAARALGGRSGLLWMYRHVPGFQWFSEVGYRFVAARRGGISRWEKRLTRR